MRNGRITTVYPEMPDLSGVELYVVLESLTLKLIHIHQIGAILLLMNALKRRSGATLYHDYINQLMNFAKIDGFKLFKV